MSMNKVKKIGAAAALASVFASGSMSAIDFKSAIGGSIVTLLALGIADVGLDKSPWNPLKKAMGADKGLWNKFTNKTDTDANKKS